MSSQSKKPKIMDMTVDEQFQKFAVKKEQVYFQPIHGNFGDDLIVMGIESVASRNGLEFSSTMENADHLLVKGGGALLDVYPALLQQFKDFFHQNSNVPTTMLPTSYLLHTTSMPELVGRREAPLHIFVRERVSYELLKDLEFEGPVSISLDADTAFHLSDGEFCNQLKATGNSSYILLVERTDPESLGNRHRFSGQIEEPSTVKEIVRRLVPVGLRAKFHQMRKGEEQDPLKSHFAKKALERIYAEHPDLKGLPIRALDVSSLSSCGSLDEFASVIADAAVVYSTRLHVGILSAMLGTPTYLVEGVYHKISGIYEYSMKQMPHVTLICNDD